MADAEQELSTTEAAGTCYGPVAQMASAPLFASTADASTVELEAMS